MIGTGELLVILCVTLILFGGKRLPELAKSLGKGIREFKKACQGIEEEVNAEIVIEDDKKEKKDPPSCGSGGCCRKDD
jgi:sec-independent protein translocase protein TatA